MEASHSRSLARFDPLLWLSLRIGGAKLPLLVLHGAPAATAAAAAANPSQKEKAADDGPAATAAAASTGPRRKRVFALSLARSFASTGIVN